MQYGEKGKLSTTSRYLIVVFPVLSYLLACVIPTSLGQKESAFAALMKVFVTGKHFLLRTKQVVNFLCIIKSFFISAD